MLQPAPHEEILTPHAKGRFGRVGPGITQHIIAQVLLAALVGVEVEHPGMAELDVADTPILMCRPIVEWPGHHPRATFLRKRAGPVHAQGVENNHIVAPGQRIQARGDVDLLIESQNQDRNAHLASLACGRDPRTVTKPSYSLRTILGPQNRAPPCMHCVPAHP